MSKAKTVFVCETCGAQEPKWLGRCRDCGAWNSLMESREPARPSLGTGRERTFGSRGARPYGEVVADPTDRISTGLDEFDRVLGGGLVPGSLVLLGGDPGIGKSTLLLSVAAHLKSQGPALYVSGEESEQQIKLRGERMGLRADSLFLFSETQLERIMEEIRERQPRVVVLDSVQTVYSTRFSSAPGSVSQVREVAAELLCHAKSTGTTTLLIGHVTKDGALAGPKALEHIVDTVLYFEGERHHAHRIVRATKNRYGATGELGVFEMTGTGLVPVGNPSSLFLAERAVAAPGSVVVCSVEGTRPLLLEIQALASRSGFGYPRRVALGVDTNRVALLLAVLEKRVGLELSGEDVFVNVAGGLAVEEPSCDLGVAAAVASSFRGRAIDARTVLLGEVGLSGEVRAVTQVDIRLREAARLGFSRVVLPERNLPLSEPGVTVVGVCTVSECLERVL